MRIDDHSTADEQLGVGIECTRRYDTQCELGVTDDDRVSGIVATAKARDDVVI